MCDSDMEYSDDDLDDPMDYYGELEKLNKIKIKPQAGCFKYAKHRNLINVRSIASDDFVG